MFQATGQNPTVVKLGSTSALGGLQQKASPAAGTGQQQKIVMMTVPQGATQQQTPAAMAASRDHGGMKSVFSTFAMPTNIIKMETESDQHQDANPFS